MLKIQSGVFKDIFHIAYQKHLAVNVEQVRDCTIYVYRV